MALVYSSVNGRLLYAMQVPIWAVSAVVSFAVEFFGFGPLPIGVARLVDGASTVLSLLLTWLLSRLFLRLSAFFELR